MSPADNWLNVGLLCRRQGQFVGQALHDSLVFRAWTSLPLMFLGVLVVEGCPGDAYQRSCEEQDNESTPQFPWCHDRFLLHTSNLLAERHHHIDLTRQRRGEFDCTPVGGAHHETGEAQTRVAAPCAFSPHEPIEPQSNHRLS